MPRRLNYTGRKKIERADARIRVHRNGSDIEFDAELRLADYKLEQVSPPPRVYVEAYRGASTLLKRFDFGRVGSIQSPPNRSLTEFGIPEGVLFRVKVSDEGESLGKLLAEADAIRPQMPEEDETPRLPLIQHVSADDIGDELWRVTDFDTAMPLLKINSRVPMGVDQFLLDPHYRAIFAPAVMRHVLTQILIIDRYTGDEEDETDWRRRWLDFVERLGISDCPGVTDNRVEGKVVAEWIDDAVEAFAARTDLFARFSQAASGVEA